MNSFDGTEVVWHILRLPGNPNSLPEHISYSAHACRLRDLRCQWILWESCWPFALKSFNMFTACYTNNAELYCNKKTGKETTSVYFVYRSTDVTSPHTLRQQQTCVVDTPLLVCIIMKECLERYCLEMPGCHYDTRAVSLLPTSW